VYLHVGQFDGLARTPKATCRHYDDQASPDRFVARAREASRRRARGGSGVGGDERVVHGAGAAVVCNRRPCPRDAGGEEPTAGALEGEVGAGGG